MMDKLVAENTSPHLQTKTFKFELESVRFHLRKHYNSHFETPFRHYFESQKQFE